MLPALPENSLLLVFDPRKGRIDLNRPGFGDSEAKRSHLEPRFGYQVSSRVSSDTFAYRRALLCRDNAVASCHRIAEMLSASRPTFPYTIQPSANNLFAALNVLLRAVDGRVILLRSLATQFDHQHDDIDLLLSESQRQQLLRAAFAQCTDGAFHCRIQQNSSSKAQLVLWTPDCSKKLMIDLWTIFDQFSTHRRFGIPADRFLNTLTKTANEQIPSLHQLAPDIDLCLLIQHLAKKRKTLTSSTVQDRIARACDRLKSWSPEPAAERVPQNLLVSLRSIADRLPCAMLIAPALIELSQIYLQRRLAGLPGNRGLRIFVPRPRRNWLPDLRKAVLQRRPTMAVIGSDGAGKSSVVAALTQIVPDAKPIVAKKLYRRSLIYQLTSGLMKRVVGMDRDRFDDHVAVLISLRALVALWIRICIQSPRQTTILDRSVASFFITDRKSDLPRLAHGATTVERLIPPTTSVLLTMSYSELTCRKLEMSAPGHTAYQRMLFEQSLRQNPVDLVLIASRDFASATALAIIELLRDARPTAGACDDESSTRKAAA